MLPGSRFRELRHQRAVTHSICRNTAASQQYYCAILKGKLHPNDITEHCSLSFMTAQSRLPRPKLCKNERLAGQARRALCNKAPSGHYQTQPRELHTQHCTFMHSQNSFLIFFGGGREQLLWSRCVVLHLWHRPSLQSLPRLLQNSRQAQSVSAVTESNQAIALSIKALHNVSSIIQLSAAIYTERMSC